MGRCNKDVNETANGPRDGYSASHPSRVDPNRTLRLHGLVRHMVNFLSRCLAWPTKEDMYSDSAVSAEVPASMPA